MEKFKKPRLLTPRGQSHKKFWQAVGLCALTAAIFFCRSTFLTVAFSTMQAILTASRSPLPVYERLRQGRRLPGQCLCRCAAQYLFVGDRPWQRGDERLLLLPVRLAVLLAVGAAAAELAALYDGAAAGAQVRRGGGGGAFLYLRRYVKNENYAVLGACLYALSGFAVYNVFFNHFVDVVALFPYLLWALDEAIYENRHGLFAFWVAVNLLNNYFFFVGQVIFLCIYFVCKLTAKDFRLTGRKFGQLLWESVLGVAMGCLLLFPAVLSLLQNPRTIDLSSGWGFLTYAKVQQYLAILLSWILPPDSPYLTSVWSEGVIKWTSMTAYLPLCSLAGAMAYWRSRKADSKKRIVAVCAVCALVPVLNSAFYALNSSYYARWYYMPSLILAAMTVNALEDPDVDLDAPPGALAGSCWLRWCLRWCPCGTIPPRHGLSAC